MKRAKPIEVTCSSCGSIFLRPKGRVTQSITRGYTRQFCSPECRPNTKGKKLARPDNHCLKCGISTENNKFCSRNCLRSYRNKVELPPRKDTGFVRICKRCSSEFKTSTDHRSVKHCPSCWRSFNRILDRDTQLIHFFTARGLEDRHRSWRSCHIRSVNRAWNADMLLHPCAKCGYSRHVELCHIIPISKFPENATLGEVNSPSNNIQLCRNCHWELDHGLFKIESIGQPVQIPTGN